jgi:hypothetical protein
MANFEYQNRNIHGTAQALRPGATLSFFLWGPLYQRVAGGAYDLELVVDAHPDPSAVTLTRGTLSGDSRRRAYTLRAIKPSGKLTLRARDQRGVVWTTFDVDVQAATPAPSTARRYTREQLRTAPDRIGWPGWAGACPNVNALVAALKVASNGALEKNTTMQGAGRNAFYEHSVGLALDVFLANGDETKRRRAHNIIRFLVANRAQVGFRNLFYEGFGFAQSGPMGGAALAEPPGFANRANWQAISWPPTALQSTFLNSPAAITGLTAAWNDTTPPFTDAATLYR